MSRLQTHLNQPTDQCIATASTFGNLSCMILSPEPTSGCKDCVARIEINHNGKLNQIVNQLETNHERTDQASNQTGTTPHCE